MLAVPKQHDSRQSSFNRYTGRMWRNPFNSSEAEAMAHELATLILGHLSAASRQSGKKFHAKADKILVRVEKRIAQYKTSHSINWYQRSRASNNFLWTLKDGGCSDDYANELTRWFVLRL